PARSTARACAASASARALGAVWASSEPPDGLVDALPRARCAEVGRAARRPWPEGGGAERAGELVGDSAGGSEGGWAAEGPESALVPAGSVLVSVGAPIQGRRRDVSPKAASRLRRAASGASGFGPGRRDASMYLPPRRRLRHEAEDGSVMRYILGSQLRILPHPAVRTLCRSCASAVDILGVCVFSMLRRRISPTTTASSCRRHRRSPPDSAWIWPVTTAPAAPSPLSPRT